MVGGIGYTESTQYVYQDDLLDDDTFWQAADDGLMIYNGFLVHSTDFGSFILRYIIDSINDSMGGIIAGEILRSSGTLMGLMVGMGMLGSTATLMETMVCLSIINILYGSVTFYSIYQKQLHDTTPTKQFKPVENASYFYKSKLNFIFLRRLLLTLYLFNQSNDKTFDVFEAIFNFVGLFAFYYLELSWFDNLTLPLGPCIFFLPHNLQGSFFLKSESLNYIYFVAPTADIQYNVHNVLMKSIFTASPYTLNDITYLYDSMAAYFYYVVKFNNLHTYLQLYNTQYPEFDILSVYQTPDNGNEPKKVSISDVINSIYKIDKPNDEYDKFLLNILDKLFEISNVVCETTRDVLNVQFSNSSFVSAKRNYHLQRFDLSSQTQQIFELMNNVFDIEKLFGAYFSCADVFSVDKMTNNVGYKMLNVMMGDYSFLRSIKYQNNASVSKLISANVYIYQLNGAYSVVSNPEMCVNYCIDNIDKFKHISINEDLLYTDLKDRFALVEYEPKDTEPTSEDIEEYGNYRDFISHDFVVFLMDINNAVKINYNTHGMFGY